MKRSINTLSDSVKQQIYGGETKQPGQTGAGSSVYSTGAGARSLTSTRAAPLESASADLQQLDEIEARQPLYAEVRKAKKKGYAQIITNKGAFNVQLHCDIVPIACDNFLTLAESGYFNGVSFHRLIPNFMMQGGDPTGTGRGGKSAFNNGAPIPDEFDERLRHDAAGVLSMANAGRKNDSKSQFFILFSPSPHLDNKHTVFGKIVGGMSEFMRLNATATNGNDAPIEPIAMEKVVVIENPFRSLIEDKDEKTRHDTEAVKQAMYVRAARGDPMANHPNRNSLAVGKYIDWSSLEKRRRSSVKH